MAGAGLAASATSQAEIVYTKTSTDVNLDLRPRSQQQRNRRLRDPEATISAASPLWFVIPLNRGNKIAAVHHQCGFRGYQQHRRRSPTLGCRDRTDSPFDATATCMVRAFESFGAHRPWLGKSDRYLGLEFYIYGEKNTRLGRMSVPVGLLLSCIGYNLRLRLRNHRRKAIIAGDEGHTAGRLRKKPHNPSAPCPGPPGLNLWRRDEEDGPQ